MIEHVYRRAAEARGVDAVVVATDDQRVAAAVEGFGGIARMTGAHHRTGMDRIAEVARDLTCAIIVNVQGDEPLVEPSAIALMVEALNNDPALQMATLRTPIRREEDYESPHVVKVVVDASDNALYFSRAPIPFGRDASTVDLARAHIGLYAYRREVLLRLAQLAPTPLECAEALEQLRALEHGIRIKVVDTTYESLGVDTPEDLEHVRNLVKEFREGNS